MSVVYDPRAAVVVVDGVTLSLPRLLHADPHAEAMLRTRSEAVGAAARNPAAARRLRAAILGGGRQVVEFTVSGEQPPTPWAAFLRLFRPLGSRGCFHDGCDATAEAEEGGTHWCTMGDGR